MPDPLVVTSEEDPRVWEALRRECALISDHLGAGAAAVGASDFERTGLYARAFFALWVGLERGAKLALTLDHAIANGGVFAPERLLRSHGHDLRRLLSAVDAIAECRSFEQRLPDTDVHGAIVSVLTEFATNVTRYYNLELLGGQPRTDDPIASWFTQVTLQVDKLHYSSEQRQRDADQASVIVPHASMFFSVVATSETGEAIRDLDALLRRGQQAARLKPWERMYVLQLARFVTSAISALGRLAQRQRLAVPYLYEYFTRFQLDDDDFRRLKTWTD